MQPLMITIKDSKEWLFAYNDNDNDNNKTVGYWYDICQSDEDYRELFKLLVDNKMLDFTVYETSFTSVLSMLEDRQKDNARDSYFYQFDSKTKLWEGVGVALSKYKSLNGEEHNRVHDVKLDCKQVEYILAEFASDKPILHEQCLSALFDKLA